MREVLFYRSKGGAEPVREYLDSLDPKAAQRVTWVLHLVEDLDRVPIQYFKKLEGSDIWEVRVQQGNNAIRILGFWDTGRFVVLCHAFSKKSQKTPSHEIRLSEQRKDDYFKRKKKS